MNGLRSFCYERIMEAIVMLINISKRVLWSAKGWALNSFVQDSSLSISFVCDVKRVEKIC